MQHAEAIEAAVPRAAGGWKHCAGGSGTLGEEGLSCSVHTGQALVDAGLHPSTGGDGTLVCSGDMLLQALVACAGVTLAAVVINRSLSVSGRVHASGVLDVRGTLGLDHDAAVGFSSIKLSFALHTEASDQEIAQLIEATEKYCVVLQTLKSPLAIEVAASVQ